ncbi:unnamed protein product [Cladocopium goreaui]|uniref:Nudix hydrolase domain-containing protein n=1 Tax=Cladocopium goreaui TaxID=2562237 RepID=A0A9P1GKR5_9DINO|nr:unnamed protein product [Cladocopium goreaui]|mmetsp:Transcript_50435/g.109943  ORF Transcript_50435/g.109943 Transcript_50435/m.109943 type:complete len:203 (-) Transcript_50435:256-864(-)
MGAMDRRAHNVQYLDPAVQAQHQTTHDVMVIGRHEQHGYLLLLNNRSYGKEFRLPCGKFEHHKIGGEGYYAVAKIAAIREMMWQTGMKLTPSRFKRIYFPAHVQERLGNKVFFEVALHDDDSLEDGETAMSGEQDFWLRLAHNDGYTFHKDLRHAVSALQGTSRTMARALLATEAMYRAETCCLGGVMVKMARKVCDFCGWP